MVLEELGMRKVCAKWVGTPLFSLHELESEISYRDESYLNQKDQTDWLTDEHLCNAIKISKYGVHTRRRWGQTSRPWALRHFTILPMNTTKIARPNVKTSNSNLQRQKLHSIDLTPRDCWLENNNWLCRKAVSLKKIQRHGRKFLDSF